MSEARLGQAPIRRKIAALRAKTIENGCTAEEEEAAQHVADLMEQRLLLEITG